MSKELEALERLYCAGNLQLNYVLSNKHKQDYESLEQTLKALDIIKGKWVNMAVLIHSKTIEEYNNNAYTPYNLTKEEFSLLKEV